MLKNMAEEINKVQQPPESKEVNKVPTSPTPPGSEKKKMGTGAKIAIGCGVLLLLLLIGLGALALAGVSFFSKVTENFEGFDNIVEQEYIDESEESYDSDQSDSIEEPDEEEDGFSLKKSTEQGLDGELESSDMLTDKFPEDIPLSGGKISASSHDDRRIVAELDVDATIQETKQWYIDALGAEGWEITSQSESEPIEGWTTVDISFASADGERRGDIRIEQTPYTQIPHVRVRELLY